MIRKFAFFVFFVGICKILGVSSIKYEVTTTGALRFNTSYTDLANLKVGYESTKSESLVMTLYWPLLLPFPSDLVLYMEAIRYENEDDTNGRVLKVIQSAVCDFNDPYRKYIPKFYNDWMKDTGDCIKQGNHSSNDALEKLIIDYVPDDQLEGAYKLSNIYTLKSPTEFILTYEVFAKLT